MIVRPYYLDILKTYRDVPLVKILAGIRRCGKSTILDMLKDDLLGSAAAQHGLEFDDEFFFAGQELFLLRHLHGVAQCAGGVRDDGDLGDGL